MNKQWIQVFTAAVIVLLVDLPWLMVSSTYVKPMVQRIQGSPLEMRYLPAAIVYLALGYLVLQPSSYQEAFLMGASVYAVYDFTNLATLKNYDLSFAIVDSLWGGALFTIVHFVLKRLQ